jgi:hypothetical protein
MLPVAPRTATFLGRAAEGAETGSLAARDEVSDKSWSPRFPPIQAVLKVKAAATFLARILATAGDAATAIFPLVPLSWTIDNFDTTQPRLWLSCRAVALADGRSKNAERHWQGKVLPAIAT